MSLALNLPINSVSFGQVSTSFLRNLYERKLEPTIFPIGQNIDLSSQSNADETFFKWINSTIGKSLSIHDRNNKIFKLWHINGSLESLSKEQVLFSFYELDSPTKEEVNIVKNNSLVLFSSSQAVDLFKKEGCSNVQFVPLFFDKYNFETKDKQYFSDTRIVFNLVGKLEKRKHHEKVLKLWASRFGNNPKYSLQCSIFNPFMDPKAQSAVINNWLEGKSYFNISFLNFMQKNNAYNDYLNSANIIIGMSGGEGWGLPEFHSVAMGKHSIILNASSYKDWANKDNSVLVEPNGKIESYDGMFFHKGQPFNQGNIHDFNPKDFLDACEKAIERVESNKINQAGLQLQKDFTVDKFTDKILSLLK
jgi:hypothetical protein